MTSLNTAFEPFDPTDLVSRLQSNATQTVIVLYETVSNALNNQTTRQMIAAELQKLGETVTKIINDFIRIQQHLEKIDRREVILDNEGNVRLWAPEWEALFKEYISLWSQSKKTACHAQTEIERMLRVILPIIRGPYDIGLKQKALDRSITHLDEFVVNGQKHADRFLQDKSKKIKSRIKQIDMEIGNLRKEIEKSEPASFFCVSDDNAVRGGTLLVTLTPPLRSILVVAWAASLVYKIYKECGRQLEVEEWENKLRELIVEKQSLEAQLSDLREVTKKATGLNPVYHTLANRLSCVHGVYNMLVQDARKLEGHLKNMQTEDDDVILERTVILVESLYSALSLALDEYILLVPRGEISGD
ncbi:hypothetical protein AX16_008708 [Volvariella volvacea WC 439]|nr:hypothetical protein AX16_008708 [Volvariella volvacea WC 439]